MNRTRYPPRKAQIGRNPSNLTVIPTELPIVSPTRTVITVPVNNAVIPPKNPVVPKKPAGNNYNTKRKRFRNRGRKRRRGRGAQYPTAEVPSDNFRWVNKNNVNQVDKSGNKNPVKEENIEKTSQNVENIAENDSMEVTSDKDAEIVDLAEHDAETPAEDNCFEEVEVASSEGEEKQVLVGFRKTKLYYLNYKKKLFFKPKIYELSSERTSVNCLNATTGDSTTVDVDVDVDVVSEAEYEYEGDNIDQGDSEDMFGKILEIEEEPVNEAAELKDEDDSIEIIDDIVVRESAEPAPKRDYKTCFEGEENGFFQAKSFIQDNLDSWKSHLIGLEYLIEILSKSKDSVENYHCVLCECDLQIQGFPEVCVLNHVSGREHVIKYLDKHFPAFNSSFSEKSELNFFTLQKFCELINEKLGHYFMCITNLDYYSVNEKKIKEVIRDASHPCETNMDFDKSNFQKKIDSDLTGELNSVLHDIIEKILNKDVKSVENGLLKDIASKSEQISKTGTKVAPIKNKNSVIGKSSVTDPVKSVDKQSKSSKPSLPKYKDNSAVASFLRLGFAATTKFGQPSSKKPPGKIGAVSGKKNKSEVEKKSPAVEKKSPEVEKKSPEVEKKSPEVEKKLPEVEKKSPEVERKSSEDVKRDQEDTDLPKDLLGGDKVSNLGNSKNNLKKAMSKGATKNLKADPKSDVPEEIEVIVIEDNADEVLSTEKTPSNISEVSANEKFPKKKGKMIFKPTIHSKHCSKISFSAVRGV